MNTYYDNGPFLQQFSAQADAVAEAKKDNTRLVALLIVFVACGAVLLWRLRDQETQSVILRREQDPR